KSLLKVSEQRNVLLARLIRGGAGGYGGAGSRLGGGMSPMRCVAIGGLAEGSGRPGNDGAVTKLCGRGVVAMDGVNVVKPLGYSARKRNLGVESRMGARI